MWIKTSNRRFVDASNGTIGQVSETGCLTFTPHSGKVVTLTDNLEPADAERLLSRIEACIQDRRPLLDLSG